MSNVMSRAELKWDSFSTNNQKIVIERHNAFGWKIDKHVMPAGSVLITHSTVEVPRNRAPNRAMYVRGRATCVLDDGSTRDDRVPGLYTQERPSMPAGTVRTTAVEETEFWCFNYTVNRKALPVLTPIRLEIGQQFGLLAGQKVFALLGRCGDLFGPAEFVAETDLTLSANTPFYGFLIAEER